MTTMTTKFSMTRDINGYNGFGLKQSNYKMGVILATGVEQHFTVNGGNAKYLAIFSTEPGKNVYVSINDTAAAFTGTLASVTSEHNPIAREVSEGDIVSFYTDDSTAIVGVTIYAI